MNKRKKKNLMKLKRDDRKNNAKKWLLNNRVKDMVISYSKRYGIETYFAYHELCELGYRDNLRIEAYEQDGTEWEYKYDGYKGELIAVPKGTPECELPYFW